MTEYLAVFEAFNPELLEAPIYDSTRIDAVGFESAVRYAELERAELYRSGFDSKGDLKRATGDLRWKIVAITEVSAEVKSRYSVGNEAPRVSDAALLSRVIEADSRKLVEGKAENEGFSKTSDGGYRAR